MGEKQQISFKIDAEVIKEFDDILMEFRDATGVKPVRQESIEAAMKDYIIKMRKQINIFNQSKE